MGTHPRGLSREVVIAADGTTRDAATGGSGRGDEAGPERGVVQAIPRRASSLGVGTQAPRACGIRVLRRRRRAGSRSAGAGRERCRCCRRSRSVRRRPRRGSRPPSRRGGRSRTGRRSRRSTRSHDRRVRSFLNWAHPSRTATIGVPRSGDHVDAFVTPPARAGPTPGVLEGRRSVDGAGVEEGVAGAAELRAGPACDCGSACAGAGSAVATIAATATAAVRSVRMRRMCPVQHGRTSYSLMSERLRRRGESHEA